MAGRAGRVLFSIFAVAGVLLFVVTCTPLVRWAARPLTTSWTDTNKGVLIVLTGSTVAYDDPPGSHFIGLNTYWRVVHAIYVWRHGHFSTMLISGLDAADTVKPLLIANGISENAIVVENRATNTHENAVYSKPVLANLAGPYVLLTSDYHMYRAAHCFAHEQIAVQPMPAPDLLKRCEAWGQRWDAFWQLITEFVTIGWYRVHGWM